METCCVCIILFCGAPGHFLSDTSRSTAQDDGHGEGQNERKANDEDKYANICPISGRFIPVITLAAPTTVIRTTASSPQLSSAPQRSAALLRLLILSVH